MKRWKISAEKSKNNQMEIFEVENTRKENWGT